MISSVSPNNLDPLHLVMIPNAPAVVRQSHPLPVPKPLEDACFLQQKRHQAIPIGAKPNADLQLIPRCLLDMAGRSLLLFDEPFPAKPLASGLRCLTGT